MLNPLRRGEPLLLKPLRRGESRLRRESRLLREVLSRRESLRRVSLRRTEAHLLPGPGLAGPADLPNLAAELARRGFAPADVAAVMGGNLRRLLNEFIGAGLAASP